jgi:amidase
MNRRKFLRNGSLTSIGLTTSKLFPQHALAGKRNSPNQDNEPDLLEATIEDLQKYMEAGNQTAETITNFYLERILKIDRQGPRLNAVIELNPDAIQIARQLDAERKKGQIRSSLHGIPVLIKDNINSGDQMMTTAGSLALLGNKAKEDAFIVKKLREAGAVLLGKTNLSEWANFRSTRSCSGWSSRGGQTKSPYVLDRNPSGSSAGSGSATAANLCVISIGSETDGSIVSPSSVNGLVGIKPTVGLWSRSGIIPISFTQDTAGPMARTVRDAAILLGICTGVDDKDISTLSSKNKSSTDYTPFLKSNGLHGKRIGIEKSHLEGNEDLVKLLNNALDILKAQGASVVETDILTELKSLGNAEFQVLLYEFKDGLNKYLAQSNLEIISLKDLITYNKKAENRVMPFFKQETLIDSESKGGLNNKEYTDALSKTTGFRKIILDVMEKNNLDALSGITNGAACCIDLVNGDYDNGPSLSTPAAITGFPHITVPMGMLHGLPIGLSFYSGPYTEASLLSIAFSYEQASLQRKRPEYIGQTGY